MNIEKIREITSNYPILSIGIGELKWNLEQDTWKVNDQVVKPVDVLYGKIKSEGLKKRIVQASPDDVIIIALNESNKYEVIDGIYSLCKAFSMNKQRVNVRIWEVNRNGSIIDNPLGDYVKDNFIQHFSIGSLVGATKRTYDEINTTEGSKESVRNFAKKWSVSKEIPIDIIMNIIAKFDFQQNTWIALQSNKEMVEFFRQKEIVELVKFKLKTLPDAQTKLPEYVKHVKKMHIEKWKTTDNIEKFPSLTHLEINEGWIDLNGEKGEYPFKNIEVFILRGKELHNPRLNSYEKFIPPSKEIFIHGKFSDITTPKLRKLFLKNVSEFQNHGIHITQSLESLYIEDEFKKSHGGESYSVSSEFIKELYLDGPHIYSFGDFGINQRFWGKLESLHIRKALCIFNGDVDLKEFKKLHLYGGYKSLWYIDNLYELNQAYFYIRGFFMKAKEIYLYNCASEKLMDALIKYHGDTPQKYFVKGGVLKYFNPLHLTGFQNLFPNSTYTNGLSQIITDKKTVEENSEYFDYFRIYKQKFDDNYNFKNPGIWGLEFDDIAEIE
jgi:hypothetical protein